VLADLKEREPQYQALAKRVSVRASGGRAAKRAAAKATSGARSRPGATAVPTRELAAADEPDDSEFADDAAPPDDELTTTGTRVSGVSGVPASRGVPGPARPGPRQQPRRSGGGSARHRPAGKKKRR
jgi:preprotein translocase subunit SecF